MDQDWSNDIDPRKYNNVKEMMLLTFLLRFWTITAGKIRSLAKSRKSLIDVLLFLESFM